MRIPRNVPTVLNTALQFSQHYGSKRGDVEEQAVEALPSGLAYGNADLSGAEQHLRAFPVTDLCSRKRSRAKLSR